MVDPHMGYSTDTESSVDTRGLLRGVPELPPHHVPRPDKIAEIAALLLSDVARLGITAVAKTPVTRKQALYGMGGIGKTVLASAVARHIADQFDEGVLWLTVGQKPALSVLQDQMARAVGHRRPFENPAQGRVQLARLFADRAILVVLDDVWDAGHLRSLDVVGERGRLLVTTRDRRVLTTLKGAAEHRLDVLLPGQALALLASWADCTPDALPGPAARVAEACGRLPLALSMIGAMVRTDVIAWSDALELLESADIAEIEHAFPDYPYPDMLRSMEVSVRALVPDLAVLYRDLAVFPEGALISESALQTLWNLSGVKTRRRIGELAARSLLFRDDRDRVVSLHNVQRMYLHGQVPDLAALHSKLVDAYAAVCPEGWHTARMTGMGTSTAGCPIICPERDGLTS